MKKRISRVFALLLCALTLGLSSCALSRANTYNYWKNGDTENLSKDHIVEKIDLGGIIKKMNAQSGDNDEIFYVFFGTKNTTGCYAAIKVYNEQAIQFEIDKLYWLDSDLNDSKQTEVEDKLGVYSASSAPALFAFKKGGLVFDSTIPYYANHKGDYPAVKLAQIAYRQLFDEKGQYSYTD